MKGIDRREAIKKASLVMGGAISAPSVLAFLQGCRAEPELTWTPTFFAPKQAVFVNEMSETVFPKTDTPGAQEMGIPKFIETMIGECYKEDHKEAFMKGLNGLIENIEKKYGKPFNELDNEVRLTIAHEENQKVREYISEQDKVAPFFWRFKEIILLGYFTTEIGANQVLQYQAIPADYNGCISLDEVGGKAWATS